ncbi:hypothetical protein [Geodermatophilus sp. SYSU D00079]
MVTLLDTDRLDPAARRPAQVAERLEAAPVSRTRFHDPRQPARARLDTWDLGGVSVVRLELSGELTLSRSRRQIGTDAAPVVSFAVQVDDPPAAGGSAAGPVRPRPPRSSDRRRRTVLGVHRSVVLQPPLPAGLRDDASRLAAQRLDRLCAAGLVVRAGHPGGRERPTVSASRRRSSAAVMGGPPAPPSSAASIDLGPLPVPLAPREP